MTRQPFFSRRQLLLQGLAAAVMPFGVRAAPVRDLNLAHLHTREQIGLVYAQGERYLPDALDALNHFLRDHYSGAVGAMDPGLYDQLHRIRGLLGARASYEVISAYRAPDTNERLRQTGGGGVAVRSLHTQGRAIDVRLPGVPLQELRDAALSLRAGGVGYYPKDGFVHIDTGRVRQW